MCVCVCVMHYTIYQRYHVFFVIAIMVIACHRLRGTGSPPAPWPVGEIAKLIAKPR